ncbi:MAG: molecular chaperone SurA, partial [Betaproteobacteria bacterium]|nr:molecular chaperone SurA [Betaproteobacteria bacterium]
MQMLRLTTISLALSISLCQPAQSQQQQADFIVAVVNTEPITFNELRLELQRAQQQIAKQRRPQPERAALTREVLDGLISDRLQLQVA